MASAQQSQPDIDALKPEDPAVLALLETNPTTPAELARAASILADLERPELGRQMLAKILAAGLNDSQWTALEEELGTAMFSGMAANQEMLPEAKQVADAVLAATRNRLQDPKRVAGLIGQLQNASPDARQEALAGLIEARGAAIAAMLDVLSDPARAGEHPTIRLALAQMGSEAVGPLLGILEHAEPALAAQSIGVLGAMNAKSASIHLLRPYLSPASDPAVRKAAQATLLKLVGRLPSESIAVRLLTDRANAYFNRQQTVRADVEGQVEVWRWDTEKQQCVARRVSAEDAALTMAARLARDAYLLGPEDAKVRQLYLASMLEAAAYERGLDEPPAEDNATDTEAMRAGIGPIENAMQYAIANDHPVAAAEAARILGKNGKADELLYRGAEVAPLVRAVEHPDRRVRLAAARAIVALKPTEPFAGSSRVPQTLAFFAATGGTRRALIGGPNRQRARELVGLLAARGFEVDTAVSGREVLRMATMSPDYELALIDVSIDGPTADILLQQLRHDRRTATLRVGLLAAHDRFERADQIARRDPMVLAFYRPTDDQAIGWQVDRLATLAPRTFVGHAARQKQAALALELLGTMGRCEGPLSDVSGVQDAVLAARYVPKLSIAAIGVLRQINSPESQQSLVDLASRQTQPIEVRQAAAEAFQYSTEQFGILLTTDQISRQYDLYNASESSDQETQRVLAAILDSIEAPTRVEEVEQEKEKP
ncbi:MAG TPA: hypothetical protein VE890_11705 [Thermoguttaceae bacterium]|nr:hypothetical protein [Thermoguttaceae bacterium]